MASIADIFFTGRLDDGPLQVDAKKAGGKAGLSLGQQMSTGIKKGSKDLISGIKLGAGIAAFGGLTEAISGTVGLLGDAVQAAREDEESQARLGAALKANIPNWTGNTQAIEATIASRQRLGFTDEEQRKSLALLVVATHDANKALAIQSTAMDLARLKGISLEEASAALIKVEGGQYRALKALGIQLPKNATATEALAAVQAAAAGSAETFAKTTEGRLLASQIKVSEAMEKLGYIIMPAVADATVVLADAVAVVADAFAEATKVIGPLAEAFGHLIDVGAGVKQTLQDIGDRVPFVAGGFELVGKAVTLPLQPLFFLKDRIDDVTRSSYKVSPATQAASDSFVDMAKTVDGKAADLRESNKIAGASFVKMADQAGDAADDVEVSFEDMRKAAGKWRHDLLSDAQQVVDDYYTVVIDQDELAATSAEISAQRRIIASASSSAAEVADAKAKLHTLERTQAQLLSDLAEHGATTSSVFKTNMAGLLKRLAKAHGTERTAILAEIRALDLLAIRAKIANGQVLTLNESIAVTLAKGGYVSAAGAAAGGGKASGGPVSAGVAYRVNEETPNSEWFVAPTNGLIVRDDQMSVGTPGGAGGTVNNYYNTANVQGLVQAKDPLAIARQLGRSARAGLFRPNRIADSKA